ncbi:MAG: MFS transporter, partial [Simkania negevensis]|nr:MFS transporter [Simkania negevensis]
MMIKKTKKHPLWPIYFVMFLDNFGFALTFAIFSPLFIDPKHGFITHNGSSPTGNLMLGTVLAGFPSGQFFGAPLIGDIADQFGRKKGFYVTIGGIILGYLFSGWAITIHSYPWLLFSRLFSGFFAGNMSICFASIVDLTPDEKIRGRRFALTSVFTGIAWTIAILVGGYFSNPKISPYFTSSLPFWITAALSALSLLAIVFFFEETTPHQKKFRWSLLEGMRHIYQAFQIKAVRPLYLIFMFWTLGWGLAYQWFGPYSLQSFKISLNAINKAQMFNGIVGIVGGYCINSLLIKKYNPHFLVKWSIGIETLFLAILFLTSSFTWFAFVFALIWFSSSITWPNILNWISLSSPQEMQGKILGISQSFLATGTVTATLLGGIIGTMKLSYLYPIASC